MTAEIPAGPDQPRLLEGVAAVDRGEYNKAIGLLADLHQRHPNNSTILHELALAYRLSGNLSRTLELLGPYEAVLPAKSLATLAYALGETGSSHEALRVLAVGLRKYPREGVLYSTLGTTLLEQRRLLEALAAYEEGIRAAPNWPSNYFNASQLYAAGQNTAVALLYLETFRLLEPSSTRSQAAGRSMEKLYRGAVNKNASEGKKIRLSPSQFGTAAAGDRRQVSLSLAFASTFGPLLLFAHDQGLSLAELHEARADFQSAWWADEGLGDNYSIPILEFQRDLKDAGFLEAYDHWLLAPAYPAEARAWADAHPEQWGAMMAYIEAEKFGNQLERW